MFAWSVISACREIRACASQKVGVYQVSPTCWGPDTPTPSSREEHVSRKAQDRRFVLACHQKGTSSSSSVGDMGRGILASISAASNFLMPSSRSSGVHFDEEAHLPVFVAASMVICALSARKSTSRRKYSTRSLFRPTLSGQIALMLA